MGSGEPQRTEQITPSAIEDSIADVIDGQTTVRVYEEGDRIDVHVTLTSVETHLEETFDLDVNTYSDYKFTINQS